MRTAARLLPCVLVLALCCSGVDDFEVTQTATAQVPAGTVLDTLPADLGFDDLTKVDVQESREYANQGVSESDVDSVRLVRVKLTVRGGGDLAFMDSVEFFVESPGLPRVRVARGGPFPAGTSEVELQLDDVELKPYVIADSMDITSAATGRRPAEMTTIDAELVLLVDVDVSGATCG